MKTYILTKRDKKWIVTPHGSTRPSITGLKKAEVLSKFRRGIGAKATAQAPIELHLFTPKGEEKVLRFPSTQVQSNPIVRLKDIPPFTSFDELALMPQPSNPTEALLQLRGLWKDRDIDPKTHRDTVWRRSNES